MTAALAAVALIPAAAQADGVKRTAAGANPAAITPTIDAFKADIGGANNGTGPATTSGFRQIGWDGAPDAGADPNLMRGDAFLNRGVLFATKGTGFKIGGDDAPQAPALQNFGNPQFQTFSPLRLFTAVGSPIVDNHFFLAGTDTSATTNAMGVVFTDVDEAGSAKLEYFDPNGKLLDSVVAPPADGGLSFAGVTFKGGERVARVRITSGTSTNLTADAPGADAVAMDDFIHAEPQVVVPQAPAPAPAPAPPTDGKRPNAALYRLLGGGYKYLIASDEGGKYRIKIVLKASIAKKYKLPTKLYDSGERTLLSGGTRVTIKFKKAYIVKLNKAKIAGAVSLEAYDGVRNVTKLSQKVTL